jgi:MtaA/CmuA family methyltransferase
MNSLERTVAAISGKPYDRLPVQPIAMTFAARHAGIPYGEYCSDGSKLAAAQLKTKRDYGFDLLLACSDPTREVMDLAGEESVKWFEDQPPAIDEANAALKDKSAISRLRKVDPFRNGRMYDRVKGIEIMRREAGPGEVVIGWVEGPLSMACGLRGINAVMLDFIDDSDYLEELMDISVDVEIRFAEAQIEAGADSIGIGDAAVSMIGDDFYEDYVVGRQERLMSAIRDMGAMTRLHMCGRTDHLLEDMKKLPVDVYELDFMTDISLAREILGPDRFICGNISTVETLLQGDVEMVIKEARECHAICGACHAVSPGCEVPPLSPPENVRAMVEYSKNARLAN